MRENPYIALKRAVNDLMRKYFTRKNKLMFYYPAKEIGNYILDKSKFISYIIVIAKTYKVSYEL